MIGKTISKKRVSVTVIDKRLIGSRDGNETRDTSKPVISARPARHERRPSLPSKSQPREKAPCRPRDNKTQVATSCNVDARYVVEARQRVHQPLFRRVIFPHKLILPARWLFATVSGSSPELAGLTRVLTISVPSDWAAPFCFPPSECRSKMRRYPNWQLRHSLAIDEIRIVKRGLFARLAVEPLPGWILVVTFRVVTTLAKLRWEKI